MANTVVPPDRDRTRVPADPATLLVSPRTATILVGGTQQFTTSGISAGVKWSSSDTTIATISKAGLARGIAGGIAVIAARAGKIVAFATLTVQSSDPPPPPLPPEIHLVLLSTDTSETTPQVFSTDGTAAPPSATIVQSVMDFGDGTTDTNAGPPDPTYTHTYDPGEEQIATFQATLTVRASNGLSASRTLSVIITHETTPPPPPVQHAPIAKLQKISGQFLADLFTASVEGTYDPDDNLQSLVLAWGDGTTTSVPLPLVSPFTVTHRYSAIGTYTWTLTATDTTARTGVATLTTTVTVPPPPPNQPPIPKLAYVSGGLAGQPYLVTAEGTSDPESGALTGTLFHGDGTSAPYTGPTTYSHTYTQPGSYTATLTVTDPGGLSASATLQIAITVAPPVNQPPTAVIAQVGSSIVGQPTTISTVGSGDPEGPLASGLITWGDGTTTPISGPPQAQYQHIYATAATRTVTLRVTDSGGLSTTSGITITTLAPPPNQAPTSRLTQTAGLYIGDTVIFSTQGSVDVEGPLASWGLDHGDGTGQNGSGPPPLNLSHVYPLAVASYQPRLVVFDSGGLSATSPPITVSVAAIPAPSTWPRADGTMIAIVEKTAGEEMTDPVWAHLHHGSAESVSLHIRLFGNQFLDPDPLTDARYTVRGVAVSPWLPLPADFTLTIDNPALPAFDGINDLGVEIRGHNAALIKPYPMYLHIGHHDGRPFATTVPAIAQNAQSLTIPTPYGTTYIDVNARNFVGYPRNPDPDPWTAEPHSADLYQEPMQPHSELFYAVQMWWQEPAGTISEGQKFIRPLAPKSGEFFLGLYDNLGQVAPTEFGFPGLRGFPVKDGAPGIGWTNAYIGGQVDSLGGWAHVNKAGSVRYMEPDGTLHTVAGWRVDPAKDPIWIVKPLSKIRENMQFRGTWTNGLYSDPYDPGFHQPMDVAIDPLNEDIWYVAGMYDNCIWKLVVNRSTWVATVSVFAGALNHASGYVDATGTAARFNKPFSLVFDPISDAIYVSDFNNDAIRKITRAGVVTTVFGNTGFAAQLLANNPGDPRVNVDERVVADPVFAYSQSSHITGTSPDIFAPYTIRVDSTGKLILFDRGFNTIRAFNLSTGAASLIIRLEQFNSDTNTWFFTNGGFGSPWVRGWAWLDVDRYGNSGPLDSIYLGMATSYAFPRQEPGSGHFNEEWWWIKRDGTKQTYISAIDNIGTPESWGPMDFTDLPHYPWAVAVDPRGGLYLAGIGEHGITKIRKRRGTDPMPPTDGTYLDAKRYWENGTGDPTKWGLASAQVFGWEGHNYIGFPDTWGAAGLTDNQLLSLFQVDPLIQANPTAKADVLMFIRKNLGPEV